MHRRRWIVLTVVLSAGVFAGIAFITDTRGVAATTAGAPADATYVGTKKCRSCHSTEYKVWRKTKHGTNFDVLQGDEKKNPDCLRCHTTGYGKPGGFVGEDASAALKSTGCEACHGPGSAHAAAAKDAPEKGPWAKKISKTPQNTCVNCHNLHVNQKQRVAKLRGS